MDCWCCLRYLLKKLYECSWRIWKSLCWGIFKIFLLWLSWILLFCFLLWSNLLSCISKLRNWNILIRCFLWRWWWGLGFMLWLLIMFLSLLIFFWIWWILRSLFCFCLYVWWRVLWWWCVVCLSFLELNWGVRFWCCCFCCVFIIWLSVINKLVWSCLWGWRRILNLRRRNMLFWRMFKLIFLWCSILNLIRLCYWLVDRFFFYVGFFFEFSIEKF